MQAREYTQCVQSTVCTEYTIVHPAVQSSAVWKVQLFPGQPEEAASMTLPDLDRYVEGVPKHTGTAMATQRARMAAVIGNIHARPRLT